MVTTQEIDKASKPFKGAHTKKDFSCFWAGLIPFKKSLEIQESLKSRRPPFYFLGFESQAPVISLGLRADESHILWSQAKQKKFEISTLKVKRGGEATLHAPGQLVIYPVIALPQVGLKVKDFIVLLQEITQSFLKKWNIKTKKGKDFAGLYTNKGKLAFFGIHISQSISQSGLSINIDNDLNLFASIKSCGDTNRSHDKLAFYNPPSLNRRLLFFKWCKQAQSFF